jgi:uncharacterized lipoprotein YbaY
MHLRKNRLIPDWQQLRAFSAASIALGCLTSPSGGPSARQAPRVLEAGERAVIEGNATYAERVALPPNAVFEAVLDDVTTADGSPTELARATIPGPATSPIPIAIAFDPKIIDPDHSYSVRARVLVDGRLWLSSDVTYPVLTRGAGRSVEIVLKRVRRDARERALGGELVYLADAARFTECSTGREYPVRRKATS